MTNTESEAALAAEISRLSDGKVAGITRHGPVLAQPVVMRETNPNTFVRWLSRRDTAVVIVLVVAWVASFAWFWLWWLEPAHWASRTGMIITSLLLLYLMCHSAYLLVTAVRLRKVDPSIPIPRVPVAYVVTRAPTEPWSMARDTLTAMLNQDYPFSYDVWLCDEDPSEEIYQWCGERDIRVSTRRGIPEYNRSEWPRRTRCKEGNLAYFYDRWGYRRYTVVVQLDCDHAPARKHLAEMVRPFADPAIGYVAAPSVCDSNATQSWSARGRLYREAPLHGASQLGHSEGLAPVIIGSHYAVRTSALREIGGIGPDLSEDCSTTLLFNSAGWQGAYAIDAEAHGEGPFTFADMAKQEFQWSRSLAGLLFGMLPLHIRRVRGRKRVRFAYMLSYYPLLGPTTVAGLALPPIAAMTGQPWLKVNYLAFLGHFWAMSACLLLLLFLLRRRCLLRPPNAPIMSWECWLYGLTRWPFVAWGAFAAFIQRVQPRQVFFRVTPKARSGLNHLPMRLVLPFLIITAVLSVAAIVGEMTTPQAGYVLLCIIGSGVYAVVSLTVPVLHMREISQAHSLHFGETVATARAPLAAAVATLIPLGFAIAVYPTYAADAFGW
ncbi:glycosyltransferase family 2 protein [Streptomyces yerevanensis]|uniref:glycosyltransferase family 2 protein n=1 Tax=Streptomyces yerevanensis TaxID=66378 RepID=UPI0005260301|nr:glycosyltransferase family 2 protein [Streptomyces yerevanensis]